MRTAKPISGLRFLGIECGGTRTTALMADLSGNLLHRVELGPANLRLITDAQLKRHFGDIAKASSNPSAIGIGMAGVRGAEDCERIARVVTKVWPSVPYAVSHDLETALLAAERLSKTKAVARVIVLSGTGSGCYGRSIHGKTAKVGGWGHLLGDKGSGYEIGLRALKATVYYYDRDQIWSSLGQRILRTLQLNEPDDLMAWAQNADKRQIAALALEVFEAWSQRDKIAADILTAAAHTLAKDAATCARRLARVGDSVEFILTGSVLLKQKRFAKRMARELAKLWPEARVVPLAGESAWGAVELARRQLSGSQTADGESAGVDIEALTQRSLKLRERKAPPRSIPESLRMSPTEERNPQSLDLDKRSLSSAIDLMLRQEAGVPRALRAERENIGRAIQFIVQAFRRGGRLFYVGAGTSGRLGVLDASECPPTFRAAPDQVQGIIAGGQQALRRSVEGAEDNFEAGARAIQFRCVRSTDVVVGIAASGRTPFVWGALKEARQRGAKTILLCFNPCLRVRSEDRPDLMIAPKVGPEVLTGSTRLKAGTATKLVLNMLTTLSMVRMGKVVSNLMVDLNPSNTKLRDRAVRIVQELTGVDSETARRALAKTGWVVKAAWQALRRHRATRPSAKRVTAGLSRAERTPRRNGKGRLIKGR